MKKFFTVMCMVSVVGLSGCAGSGEWTPMSGGRTAGDSVIKNTPVYETNKGSADATFNSSLRK